MTKYNENVISFFFIICEFYLSLQFHFFTLKSIICINKPNLFKVQLYIPMYIILRIYQGIYIVNSCT